MNALAGSFQFGVGDTYEQLPRGLAGVDPKPWGYIVGGAEDAASARSIGALLSRFGGAILFMAGIGLWLMPDSLISSDVYVMKMAAMVMFTLVGGVLVWSGRQRPGMEIQVDTNRRELRLGGRDLHGQFKLHDILRFDEVSSVFLLRSAGNVPARLYLRIGSGDTGVEVARGPQDDLEALRIRLTYDLKDAHV